MTTQQTHDCGPSGHPWTLDDFSDPTPADARLWNDDGVVILEDFFPHDLLDRYVAEWHLNNGYRGIREDGTLDAERPGGYASDTPYLDHRALFDVVTYGPLAAELENLIGEPAAVHLNLTPFVSTERSFHADAQLNERGVDARYAAVWICVGPDSVSPDAGPFQFVRGSNHWGSTVTKEKLRDLAGLDLRNPSWPKLAEDYIYDLYLAEIEKREAEVVTFLPKKGDCLIWGSFTVHQGSRANIPGHYRGSLIAHYSGARPDMPQRRTAPSGGQYIEFRPLAFDPTEGV